MCSPTLPQVLDFLCYLFDDLKLCAGTIEGYRSMLSSVLPLAAGLDIAGNKFIADLLSSFRGQRPSVPKALPDWDIALVLHALTLPPFEPLGDASLKDLTLKTCFLLLLASGRRRSDVHAIDVDRTATRSDGTMLLYPSRDFVPKTRAAREGNSHFSPIKLISLSKDLDLDDPDRFLCPVRSVRFYIERVKHLRGTRKRLFISYQLNRKSDISVSSITVWVKKVVAQIYANASSDICRLFKVTPHQLRHVSVSIASSRNCPLEDILSAGMWTSPTTFLSHYLHNMDTVLMSEGASRLGPVVMAQSRVSL
jgi:integrase